MNTINPETTLVNAESVAAGAYTTIAAAPTNGRPWAKVVVLCNKNHTIDHWGKQSDFTAVTAARKISDYTRTGKTDNTAYGGETYHVLCAGHAFFAPRVQNNDGSNAATISVVVSFFD